MAEANDETKTEDGGIETMSVDASWHPGVLRHKSPNAPKRKKRTKRIPNEYTVDENGKKHRVKGGEGWRKVPIEEKFVPAVKEIGEVVAKAKDGEGLMATIPDELKNAYPDLCVDTGDFARVPRDKRVRVMGFYIGLMRGMKWRDALRAGGCDYYDFRSATNTSRSMLAIFHAIRRDLDFARVMDLEEASMDSATGNMKKTEGFYQADSKSAFGMLGALDERYQPGGGSGATQVTLNVQL